MPVQVTCEICGKHQLVARSRAVHYKTCSVQCRGQLSSRTLSRVVEMNCVVCGAAFESKPSHRDRRRCCSRECLGMLHRQRYCQDGNPNYRGKGSYPLTRDENRVLRKVHTEAAKRHLGLDEIPKGYGVHHRDTNKLNNDPENLVFMSNSDHKWLHHQFGIAVMRGVSKGEISEALVAPWSDDPERAERLLKANLINQSGVVKPRELLGSPAEGDRQPSHSGTDGRFND